MLKYGIYRSSGLVDRPCLNSLGETTKTLFHPCVLPAMADILSLLASAAIGGLIADIAGKSAWSYIRRPKLEVSEKVKTRKIIEDKWDSHYTEVGVLYQTTVTNRGKSAAKNCKPRLTLNGERYDAGDENTDYEHTAEAFVCWSESGHPSRITINPGETVSFDLLKVDFEAREERNEIYLPSDVGWEENTPLQYRDLDSGEMYDTVQFIAPIVVEDTNWSGSYIEVTAENAEKDTASIDISWDEDDERAKLEIL